MYTIFYLMHAGLSINRYDFVGYFTISMDLGGQPGQEDIIMVGEVLYGLLWCVYVCVYVCTCMHVYTCIRSVGIKYLHSVFRCICMVT